MTQIIGFAGNIGSGKDTSSRLLIGMCAATFKVITDFVMTEDGRVSVNGIVKDENLLCPNIAKNYKFATALKEFCGKVFDIDIERTNTDKQYKDSLTKVRWEDFPGFTTDWFLYNSLNKFIARKQKTDSNLGNLPLQYHEPGFMTVREVLQYFGTEIVRKMHSDAWVNATMYDIKKENPVFAFISDARFTNEFKAIKDNGGILVKLTRCIEPSQHKSEQDIYSWTDWDVVINNDDGDLRKLYRNVLDGLYAINALCPPPYRKKNDSNLQR